MSLASTADHPRHATAGSAVHDLLVLWQHPETRQIHPIGRFSFDGETYSFSYTRHAHGIADFRPLPGLPLDGEPFRSTRMPTLFRQRTMSPSRPDFGSAMQNLGIAPEDATPWEQIVHSGGRRAGDTLQFMQLPVVAEGRVRMRFLTNGIRHIPNGTTRIVDEMPLEVSPATHERALGALRTGEELRLLPEQGNPEDADAVLIVADRVPVGWAPRVLATGLRELMEGGRPIRTTVARIAGPSAPPHVRLVVDLVAEAPPGFMFDVTGAWEPYRR